MTNILDADSSTPKTGILPFESGALDRSGLRLTRAEFARFLGVSKQAVGEWVTAGKITLGADGRLDPRQAVSQLIRNTDPARIRAKVLEPLARDIGKLQQRIAELEAKLAQAAENADFHEEASYELIDQWAALVRNLNDERDGLALLPTDKVVDAIIVWMKRVANEGAGATNLAILDCVPGNGLDIPLGALEENTGGDGGESWLDEEIASLPALDELKRMEGAGDD